MDKGAIYTDEPDLGHGWRLSQIDEALAVRDAQGDLIGPLRTLPEHTLLDQSLAYHRQQVAGVH